ncbi:hypothetical protein [Clostridium sp. C8-1-8]|uniref:hypothetical protein n=1 Tax=Clostridium sp. C8-1-8 TaxID=2698831 RepID=UPI00136AA5C6|nr:hypothetical protein [Clostridium sp. C8-1-8]
MKNRLEGAELTIYKTDGESFAFDLSPTQLLAICKILGINFDEKGNMTCFSDEGLKKFMEVTVDRMKLSQE